MEYVLFLTVSKFFSCLFSLLELPAEFPILRVGLGVVESDLLGPGWGKLTTPGNQVDGSSMLELK